MGNLEKIPAWQLTKVKSKKDVIDEARKGKQNSSLCFIDESLGRNAQQREKHKIGQLKNRNSM